METLAIVAYRQPIVKAEIESIRGVDVGAPLKGLLEKKLVRIVGRKDVPGRPIIYGTTKKFLEVFNLKDLSELPTLRELKELHEQQETIEDFSNS
jgi:segregation and condensation protein B